MAARTTGVRTRLPLRRRQVRLAGRRPAQRGPQRPRPASGDGGPPRRPHLWALRACRRGGPAGAPGGQRPLRGRQRRGGGARSPPARRPRRGLRRHGRGRHGGGSDHDAGEQPSCSRWPPASTITTWHRSSSPTPTAASSASPTATTPTSCCAKPASAPSSDRDGSGAAACVSATRPSARSGPSAAGCRARGHGVSQPRGSGPGVGPRRPGRGGGVRGALRPPRSGFGRAPVELHLVGAGPKWWRSTACGWPSPGPSSRPQARVEDVMEFGVSSVGPSEDLEALAARMRPARVGTIVVTRSTRACWAC